MKKRSKYLYILDWYIWNGASIRNFTTRDSRTFSVFPTKESRNRINIIFKWFLTVLSSKNSFILSSRVSSAPKTISPPTSWSSSLLSSIFVAFAGELLRSQCRFRRNRWGISTSRLLRRTICGWGIWRRTSPTPIWWSSSPNTAHSTAWRHTPLAVTRSCSSSASKTPKPLRTLSKEPLSAAVPWRLNLPDRFVFFFFLSLSLHIPVFFFFKLTSSYY